MNISEANYNIFPNNASQPLQIHPAAGDHHLVSSSFAPAGGPETANSSPHLLYRTLSMLKDKVYQAHSLVSILISEDHQRQPPAPAQSLSLALASINSLVQEIFMAASSLTFVCQQMSLATPSSGNDFHQSNISSALDDELKSDHRNFDNNNNNNNNDVYVGTNLNTIQERDEGNFYSGESTDNWYGSGNYDTHNTIKTSMIKISEGSNKDSPKINYDIIELDVADLLAKYTCYCQVCGKGFRRDANLRMHMRAHGDEYKTSAALTNPTKNKSGGGDWSGEECSTKSPKKKYSCPQDGCRWNQKHAKFQPLKSMICVKNHYKRSHCPKMYVCKRCNKKRFSVLSDLRTHEKHCGDLKWQCSCGNTFSRKEKLMGHVTLFAGHSPAVLTSSGNKAI